MVLYAAPPARYPIEQLASKSNFLEVAYLLIYGELPTKERLDTWENEVCVLRFAERGRAPGDGRLS